MIRLFFLFLIIGLITDVTMFYLIYIVRYERLDHLRSIFNFYSLIESLVFFLFTLRNIRWYWLRSINKILLILAPFFWLFFIQLYPEILFAEKTAGQAYGTIYEICAAFLSGFALLQMVEKEESLLSSFGFWILLGIFFYCFCTFFIMGFLNTILSQQIWFLNNIFNILTYGFYSIGLWKYRKGSNNL
jgi:hypothetical protein